MSSERDPHADSTLTPSEPSAQGYEPGEAEQSEDSQESDPSDGRKEDPPGEAQPA